MSVFKILKLGDKTLRKKSDPVVKLNNEIKEFATEMLETMVYFSGLGLAAPQVGKNIKIITYDTSRYVGGSQGIMINPRISGVSGEIEFIETCLSVPNEKIKIKRYNEIEVLYYNISGEPQKEQLEGITAVVVQHEIDHLEGKLIIDYKKEKK